MTNIQVIQSFISKRIGNSLHLYSDCRRLLSYNTCIAEYYNGSLIVNNTKYSRTTSRHRSILIEIMPNNIPVINVLNVPKGTQSLIQYI